MFHKGKDKAAPKGHKRRGAALRAWLEGREDQRRDERTVADDPLANVKARVGKILSLGLHPDTPAAEQAHAMRLARKIMDEHHLKQAEVMSAHEGSLQDAGPLAGGLSAAFMERTASTGSQGVSTKQVPSWVHSLARAVADFTNSKYFYDQGADQVCSLPGGGPRADTAGRAASR
jgi:hypothetical protein